MARSAGGGLRELAEAGAELAAENFGFGDLVAFQFREREVDAPARGVVAHVAEDVGELERLPEVDGVVTAGGAGVAEDFNAQQPDDGRDVVAIFFQRFKIFVAQRVDDFWFALLHFSRPVFECFQFSLFKHL